MQKKLQQFDNTLLKKQTDKLQLEIKLSLINSLYHHHTLSRSPKYTPSPTTKNSLSIRPFDSTDRTDFASDAETDLLDDRVFRIQHELEKQFSMISKYKQILKERLAEYQHSQLCRQKYIKELHLKRRLQIENLKRDIKIAIKMNIDQRQFFFQRLEAEFNQNIDNFVKTWKKVKKIWKNQLKAIIAKFQGQKIPKDNLKNIKVEKQSAQHEEIQYSLKGLEKQLKDHWIESEKDSLKLQLELSTMIQHFQLKRQELKKRFESNLGQILEEVQKLQKSIKKEVKKEQFQAEQNREKLLMLLQENVQKIQNQGVQRVVSRFRPPMVEYRHLKNEKSQRK